MKIYLRIMMMFNVYLIYHNDDPFDSDCDYKIIKAFDTKNKCNDFIESKILKFYNEHYWEEYTEDEIQSYLSSERFKYSIKEIKVE